jgi:hypothetical protein
MLFTTTAFAHAANPFIAGSHWTGFRVSTVGGGTSNAKLDVGINNANIGTLTMFPGNQGINVTILYNQSGTVDMKGIAPNAGVLVHGVVSPQGGTYSLSSNYTVINVPGLHNDSGRLSLLRSYKTPTGGPIGTGGGGTGLVPPDPYLPPDPYFGTFTTITGYSGRVVFEHNPPSNNPAEHNPPSNFDGMLNFNDGAYAVVGTVNPVANLDGSRTIEMLGEGLNPNSIVPCVKTQGLLLPAVRIGGPTRIVSDFLTFGLRFSNQGRFEISQ